MVAAKQGELIFPVRWWSFGPFWRYEQPQKGRSREFFQWNIDLLGADSPEADAELIAVAATFLRSVGLAPEQATIFVNDRRLMDSQFRRPRHPSSKNEQTFRISWTAAPKWNPPNGTNTRWISVSARHNWMV